VRPVEIKVQEEAFARSLLKDSNFVRTPFFNGKPALSRISEESGRTYLRTSSTITHVCRPSQRRRLGLVEGIRLIQSAVRVFLRRRRRSGHPISTSPLLSNIYSRYSIDGISSLCRNDISTGSRGTFRINESVSLRASPVKLVDSSAIEDEFLMHCNLNPEPRQYSTSVFG
jgi:hypothetical protein